MSLLSARLGFTHRCTIERDTSIASASANDWGTPGTPDWQPHLEDQPCRFWIDAGREDVTEDTTVAPVVDARLIVPAGTDVTEADRIVSVTVRGGNIQEGPLGVRAVLWRPDHIELVLVKV